MPVKGNQLICLNCKHIHIQLNFISCEKCGFDLGAPNVNIVSSDDEINALNERYKNARTESKKNGNKKIRKDFEAHFNKNVRAIINVSLETLFNCTVQSKSYKNYSRSVELDLRPIANVTNDHKRNVIDSLFYGSYGRFMTYATITLNDKGLENYGNCRIFLDESTINFRASVLEENSFNFVNTHKINLETMYIPKGYRSNWFDKIKLVVSKVYNSFNTTNNIDDFDKMVLNSSSDRSLDEYVEVVIYKEITKFAMNLILLPKPCNIKDEITVKAIEEKSICKVNRF